MSNEVPVQGTEGEMAERVRAGYVADMAEAFEIRMIVKAS